MDAFEPVESVDCSRGPSRPAGEAQRLAEGLAEGRAADGRGTRRPVCASSSSSSPSPAAEDCGGALSRPVEVAPGCGDAAEDGNESEPVDLSPEGDGRYLKVVTRGGFGSERPAAGDRVLVRVAGRTSGSGVACGGGIARSELVEFNLDEEYSEEVPRAVHLAVLSMRQGEVCRLSWPAKRGAPSAPPATAARKTPRQTAKSAGIRTEFELELLSWKGQDLSAEKNGGILKSTLCAGTGSFTPTVGSAVEAELIGKIDGRIFENRVVTFTCGDGSAKSVIDGVDFAITSLVAGERARLTVRPEYAFGSAGQPALGVPPDAAVTYEVSLRRLDGAKEPWEFSTWSERLSESRAYKETGNCLYGEGKPKHALRWYERAARLADGALARPADLQQCSRAPGPGDACAPVASPGGNAELQLEQQALFVAATLNMSLCHLKLARFGTARDLCDSVLAIDATNQKALMRRLEASRELEDWESAKRDCLRYLEVDPRSRAVKAHLDAINGKLKAERDKQKEVCARMLSKPAGCHGQGIRRPEDKTIFDEPVGEWSNDMAAGIMTLQQELQAFGECMPDDAGELSGGEDNPSEPQG